jgi:rhodanese-related sulfurtransferase
LLDIFKPSNILENMKTIRDALLIVIIASALGLAVNAGRIAGDKGGLALNTPWPDNRKLQVLETPPSYDATMDTLISLADAYNLFLQDNVIFLDAREPEDYRSGHIKGAINFPFEEWDDYWPEVEPKLHKDAEMVAYCGGLDCEASLFLARELKQRGYAKCYTFFGGILKWQEEKLPMEKSND